MINQNYTNKDIRNRLHLGIVCYYQLQHPMSSPSYLHTERFRSRDSAVGIATGYGLDDRGVGVQVPVGVRIFSSSLRPGRLWGPSSLLSNVYRETLYPGVKRPGREDDHSPPTSTEVKKMWIYTSTPPIRLHGVVLN
jgi:hypothetical protein